MMVPSEKPVRTGIIIESFQQPRWVRRCLEEALATQLCTFALAAKVQPEKKREGGVLYRLYNRMDRSLFGSDATELVDLEVLLNGVPVVENLDQIAAFNPDLLINFGSAEWNTKLADLAREGVWFYSFGDSPGFNEVMDQIPITHTSLRSLQGETEKIIYYSASPTLSRFSVALNNNTRYWKSAAFVARALKDLHQNRTKVKSLEHAGGLTQALGNAAMSRMFLKLFGRAAAGAFEKISSSEQWILAFRLDQGEFRYLIPPPDRFWADPFPIKVEGRHHIFFEEYLRSSNRAHISVIEIDQNGIVSGPSEVLKLDYHLSYPFIFEWRGDYYMIPETGEKNVVELYRCVSFPFKWQPERVLLEANFPLDATLVEADGKWWMFVNIQEEGVAVNWDELHLYYSESPLGPWKPHARNPVVSDVRSARPAGRLFWSKDYLYRPSQDSSLRYGYATTINKVTKLTVSEYEETEVLKIVPNWDRDIIGVHTLNLLDDITVIDCLTKRRRFRASRFGSVKGSLDLHSSANMATWP